VFGPFHTTLHRPPCPKDLRGGGLNRHLQQQLHRRYNITLYHGKTTDDPAICTSLPTYGTKAHTVGNEKGYVVAMTKCKFLKEAYVIKKGEPLTLQATYNVGEVGARHVFVAVMSQYFRPALPPAPVKRCGLDSAAWLCRSPRWFSLVPPAPTHPHPPPHPPTLLLFSFSGVPID
jgi:hypothetical protein